MKITKEQLEKLIKEEIESLSVGQLDIAEQDEYKYSKMEILLIQRFLEIAIKKAFRSLRDGSAVERERAVRDAFGPAMEEAMRMLHSDE